MGALVSIDRLLFTVFGALVSIDRDWILPVQWCFGKHGSGGLVGRDALDMDFKESDLKFPLRVFRFPRHDFQFPQHDFDFSGRDFLSFDRPFGPLDVFLDGGQEERSWVLG